MIIDWDEWMAKHHIKIGGRSNDGGSDEMRSGGGISRTEMETQMSNYAGASDSSHIQKPKRKKQTEQKKS